MEIWKTIIGTNSEYSVSNTGKIRANTRSVIRKTDGATITRKEKIIKTRILRNYETVGIYINGAQVTKMVHRLVAEAFIGNPEGKPEVNHKDGNKLNNELNNLEWVTKSENDLHAFKMGLRVTQCGNTSKKVAKTCAESGEVVTIFDSLRALERNSKYNRKYVSLACRNGSIYKGYYWNFV